MHDQLRNERGMTLAFTAVALAAFIGLTVVGVDLARLAFTATEVQTVADIAATAGARTLLLGGTEAEVDADAMTTVSNSNTLDGTVASIDAEDVDLGVYEFTTSTFTETNVNPNAVKADGRKTVTNFVAAALGPDNATTNVHKIAVAAISGPAAGCAAPEGSGCAEDDWDCFCEHGSAPCLPITAPDCQFTALDQLPALVVSGSTTDTAAWTGFQIHDTNNIRSYLDQGPCEANGQADTPGAQNIGSGTINVTNGQNADCSSQGQPFALMGCIWQNQLGCRDTNNDGIVDDGGGTIFTIPIVHLPTCGTNFTGDLPLVGFATVDVTGACVNGVRQVDLQVIARTSTTPGPPGGGCFGSDCSVTLTK